ncbi:hypothetical protein OROMI_003854 [Orobanche minor]
MSAPIPFQQHQHIAIALVNDNYFVQIFLNDDYPVPPIALLWWENVSEDCKEWADPYEEIVNGSSFGKCGPVDSDPSPSNMNLMTGIADDILKQKNIDSVLFGGKRLGEQGNSKKLDWFAEQLVLEHQQRIYWIAPTIVLEQPALRPS